MGVAMSFFRILVGLEETSMLEPDFFGHPPNDQKLNFLIA
jgi:hypothetical protein